MSQSSISDEVISSVPEMLALVEYFDGIRAVEAAVSAARRGDWMQTFTGQTFYPMDPRPEDIHVEDIAHALSLLCRYGGHCLRFYSVAEHSVLMAEQAPDEFKLAALLHDASEAYLSDVIRPIKRHLTNYAGIERSLECAIGKRFGVTLHPMAPEVKRLDNAILADERLQNMAWTAVPNQEWGATEPPLGVTLKFWTPERAAFEFRAAFLRYGGHWA
jgi:hypothetical protein